MTTSAESIEAVAAELGLTMRAEFIPWSLSRNAGENLPSLNWKISLLKNGREFLTTDYMAGCGHCPAYKASVAQLGNQNSILRTNAIRFECENGHEGRYLAGVDSIMGRGKPLTPKFADVLHSLASDADAIDYGSFEEWAESFGADTDSRKAEATYRACLEIALKLRNALGEEGFKKLREATQDY